MAKNTGTKTAEPKAAVKAELKIEKKKTGIILRDVLGNDVDWTNYFYSDGSEAEEKIIEKSGSLVPSYFNRACGFPVEREELVEVFNKFFPPEAGFLFYKCVDKEVYLVIVPLKYSDVDDEHGAVTGDFQKHAMSFLSEGSVNLETLKMKLKRIASAIGKLTNR